MKPRAVASLAVAIACTASSRDARAYRPFDGTDADVSRTGQFEIELGPIGYLRAQHDSALVFASSVINWGFLPRWELVIQGVGLWGLDASPPPPRFLDGGVFLKRVLREGTLQDKHGISLATEFGVLLPTSDEPFVSSGVYLALIASYAWRELVIHVNASIARSSDGNPDFFGSVILEGHPSGRIRPVSEIFVDRHDGITEPSCLIGFIARAGEHISFDAATRFAWLADAPLFEIRAGLTWSFTIGRLR